MRQTIKSRRVLSEVNEMKQQISVLQRKIDDLLKEDGLFAIEYLKHHGYEDPEGLALTAWHCADPVISEYVQGVFSALGYDICSAEESVLRYFPISLDRARGLLERGNDPYEAGWAEGVKNGYKWTWDRLLQHYETLTGGKAVFRNISPARLAAEHRQGLFVAILNEISNENSTE